MGFIDTILSPLIYATSFLMVVWHKVFGALFGGNSSISWVLSILFLTITIRAAMIPLFRKQIKSMRNMQVLQPKIQALQKKYKLDKQKLQQEMMKLYKENGTSPFASCLPIIIQMPFFTALFRVLSHVANGQAIGALSHTDVLSAQRATFFGAPIPLRFLTKSNDPLIATLAQAGEHVSMTNLKIVSLLMVVLYALSQFFTQRMMLAKNTNLDNSVPNPMMQSQRLMLYVMPVGMLIFGLSMQIGVVLYLMTTNVWTIGQQFYTLRNSPMPGSKAEQEMIARKKAKDEKARTEAAGGGPVQDKVPSGVNGSVQDAIPAARPARVQPKNTPRSKRKK